MWLKDTIPVSLSDNIIKIKVMDEVAKKHIIDQYLPQISASLNPAATQWHVHS